METRLEKQVEVKFYGVQKFTVINENSKNVKLPMKVETPGMTW